jgi:ABC-type sugar transport system substrate-binding protein
MFSSMVKSMLRATVAGLLLASIPTAVLTHAAQAGEKKPVIRYIFKFSSTWWPPEIDAKIRAVADQLGVDYQEVGPEGGDIAKQVAMIENFVSQKVDVLAVSSLGPATCQAIDDAIDAGVKVVMADGDCSGSKRIAYYGSNNESLGADAAVLFAEAVKGKGHQKILVVTGTPGAQNLQEREQGFKDKLKALGVDAEYLPTIPCYEDTQKAIDAIESSLRADPTITGLYVTALWPFQAEASALPVMTSRVKDGKLTAVNVDAFPNGLKLVEDGYLYGQVSQNLGQLTVGPLQFAYQVGIKGVKFPAICSLSNTLITKDGGPGRVTAADFTKKIWKDYDWDTHTVTPADCR